MGGEDGTLCLGLTSATGLWLPLVELASPKSCWLEDGDGGIDDPVAVVVPSLIFADDKELSLLVFGSRLVEDESTLVTEDELTLVTKEELTLGTKDGLALVTKDALSLVTKDELTLVTKDGLTLVTKHELTLVTKDGV